MDQREKLEEGETLNETENKRKTRRKQNEDELDLELCENSSMDILIRFKSNNPPKSPQHSYSSSSSGQLSETDQPPSPHEVKISELPSGQNAQHQTSIFMEFKKDISTFVKNELKKIQMVLDSDYPDVLEGNEDEDDLEGEDKEQMRKAFETITQYYFRRMNKKELANHLQTIKTISL